jgi:hypothetical protein
MRKCGRGSDWVHSKMLAAIEAELEKRMSAQ